MLSSSSVQRESTDCVHVNEARPFSQLESTTPSSQFPFNSKKRAQQKSAHRSALVGEAIKAKYMQFPLFEQRGLSITNQ